MHRAPILIFVLKIFAAGQETTTVEAPRTAAECVRVFASPGTHWRLFAACEARLEELPAGDVMPLVASHELREMPGSRTGRVMIWNGMGSAETGARRPASLARPLCAAAHLGPPSEDRADRGAPSDPRGHLQRQDGRRPRAGPSLSPPSPLQPPRRAGRPARRGVQRGRGPRDARGQPASVEDRCAGASVLWTMGRQKDTIEVLLAMPSSREVIDLLAGTATMEPRAVPKAFEFLEDVISRKPGSLYERFLAADSVGRVLDAALSGKSRFSPDMRDPKYRRPLEGAVLNEFSRATGPTPSRTRSPGGKSTATSTRRKRSSGAASKKRAPRPRRRERERAAAAERERNSPSPAADGAVAPHHHRHGRHLPR